MLLLHLIQLGVEMMFLVLVIMMIQEEEEVVVGEELIRIQKPVAQTLEVEVEVVEVVVVE